MRRARCCLLAEWSTEVRHLRIALRSAGYLVSVRSAIPLYLRVIAGMALVFAEIPRGAGIAQLLCFIVAAVLWFRHRALVRACWRAAQLDFLVHDVEVFGGYDCDLYAERRTCGVYLVEAAHDAMSTVTLSALVREHSTR